MPLQTLFRADPTELEPKCKSMIAETFRDIYSEKTFSVRYEHRSNTKMDRVMCIKTLASFIQPIDRKVKLREADYEIHLQVICNIAGLSILSKECLVRCKSFKLRESLAKTGNEMVMSLIK